MGFLEKSPKTIRKGGETNNGQSQRIQIKLKKASRCFNHDFFPLPLTKVLQVTGIFHQSQGLKKVVHQDLPRLVQAPWVKDMGTPTLTGFCWSKVLGQVWRPQKKSFCWVIHFLETRWQSDSRSHFQLVPECSPIENPSQVWRSGRFLGLNLLDPKNGTFFCSKSRHWKFFLRPTKKKPSRAWGVYDQMV